MIKDHGLSVTTEMKDIRIEQIMPLFHCLINQKSFSTSGFTASAQLRKENKEKENWCEDWKKSCCFYASIWMLKAISLLCFIAYRTLYASDFWYFGLILHVGKCEGLNRNGHIVCPFELASAANLIKFSRNWLTQLHWLAVYVSQKDKLFGLSV